MPVVRLYNFKPGTTIRSAEANAEFDNLVTGINNLENTVNNNKTNGDKALANHRTAATLDHPDGSVVTSKLAQNAVVTSKIADESVTGTKLAPAAVSTNRIADSAITTAKIADSNVTGSKIAASAIRTEHIADETITGGKLAPGSVSTSRLPDGAITTPKIAERNVTGSKIAFNTITGEHISDGSITTNKIANGAMDGRYYTKGELDTNTRDHKGTWRGMTPELLGDPILSQRITKLENTLAEANTKEVILHQGNNILASVANDTLAYSISVPGRTLVNLLGNDGNCEKASRWRDRGSTKCSFDPDNKVYGDTGLKVILAGTVDYGWIDTQLDVVPGKCYVALAEIKNGDARRAYIELGSSRSQYATDPTKFATVYLKYKAGTSTNKAELNLHVSGSAPGQYAFFDGIRIYEIDPATYNKIDVDLEFTGQKLVEKYPYVDNMKSLQGVYLRQPGKNLVPPFIDWEPDVETLQRIIDPYTLAIDSTTYNATIRTVEIPILPFTTYTLSGSFSVPGISLDVMFLTPDGVYEFQDTIHSAAPSVMFQTFATSKIQLKFNTDSVGVPFTIKNIQLEMSASQTTFEPKNEEYLFYPGLLASGTDGRTFDFLFQDDVGWYKSKNFEQRVLDGSLPWLYNEDYGGRKRVFLPANTFPSPRESSQIVIKYNGAPLANTNSWDWFDQAKIGPSGDLYITIADTDSGWGDNYKPSDAEVKAYFWGWKMYNAASGNFLSPYDNTGTKAWTYRTGVGQWANGVTTLPTSAAPLPTDKYVWRPYQLQYQLDTPITETVQVEGAVSLHEGNNLIEVGTGAIVREKVSPQASGSVYEINRGVGHPSTLKNRTNAILGVYKNSIIDPRWRIQKDIETGYFNGGAGADIPTAQYDPSATYTVTYLVLDKYLFTGAVSDAKLSYGGSFKTVQDELVQQVTDIKGQVTINTNSIIDIIVRLKAGGL